MKAKELKKSSNSDRTWRTQCVNYLAWGRSRLSQDEAIRHASGESEKGTDTTIDETNKVVYYRVGICL